MVERMPSYLSPSSLSTIEKQPHKYFLTKCLHEPILKREPQSKPAAVGTAFDCLVKQALHENGVPFGTKIPDDRVGDAYEYFVEDLYSSLENHKVEAMEAGNAVMRVYKKAGLVGKTKTNWKVVEGQHNMILEGVPILGKLDAIVYDDEYGMRVPFDWKVSGYSASSGMSPKQGYVDIFDPTKGWCGSHKSYRRDIRMEEIDEGFARQFATYGWMLGHYDKEFPVYFDQILFNGDNSNIRVARFRAIITREFQQKLLGLYKTAWESLKGEDFMNRLISRTDYAACELMAMGESWF